MNYLSEDEGLFELAKEKMGYIPPVVGYNREKGWDGTEAGKNAIDYKEMFKSLHYNLGYSQGDYAYIEGYYNLGHLVPQIKEELKTLAKYSLDHEDNVRVWFLVKRLQPFETVLYNEDGFAIKRDNTPMLSEVNDRIDGFIYDLERVILPNVKKRMRRVVMTILSVLKKLQSKKDTSISKIFEVFEYELMQVLYSQIEAEEEYRQELEQELEEDAD